MIEFTFVTSGGAVLLVLTVSLDDGKKTGGEAFEEAARKFRSENPSWYPGKPGVIITMKGV